MHKDDLGELLGLDKRNSINVAIDRIYKELSSRVAHFIIEEPLDGNKQKVKKVHSVVPIIRELRWEDDGKNALQIRFTSEVLPYFTIKKAALQMESGFTNYFCGAKSYFFKYLSTFIIDKTLPPTTANITPTTV